MSKWKDLDAKTKIAYLTAIAAFIIGWGLTIAGFCVPPVGEIADSLLWILGQALVYCASIFGVSMYTVGSVKGMKREIAEFLHKKEEEQEEE